MAAALAAAAATSAAAAAPAPPPEASPRSAGPRRRRRRPSSARARLPALAAAALASRAAVSVAAKEEVRLGAWIVGDRGAPCDEACAGVGLACYEGMWPLGEEELWKIARGLDFSCEDVQAGGSEYDPSATDMHCGWQAFVSKAHADSRCRVTPPSFTTRFCPCVERTASATDGGEPRPSATLAPPRPLDSGDRKRAAPPAMLYNCDAGLASWRGNWTAEKQVYCCKAFKKGCWYELLGAGTAIDARRVCEQHDRRLPMPRSAEEQKALEAAVQAHGVSTWLGGSYSGIADSWQWDDGLRIASHDAFAASKLKAVGSDGMAKGAPWLAMTSDGVWRGADPQHKFGILCKVEEDD